jgi:hypothetical protein
MKKVVISTRKYRIVIVAAIAGISGCLIDSISMTVLGGQIKGYSRLSDTMSAIGASTSPVDHRIAIFWILIGILFIIFGWGIRFAFNENRRLAKAASWLIILYGAGEGLGSALFPADPASTQHSWIGLIHYFVSAVGAAGIAIFPLVMVKLIPEFRRFSIIVFVAGLTGLLFFGFGQFLDNPNNFFVITKGLWQRLFIYAYYAYIIVVSVKLIGASISFKKKSALK